MRAASRATAALMFDLVEGVKAGRIGSVKELTERLEAGRRDIEGRLLLDPENLSATEPAATETGTRPERAFRGRQGIGVRGAPWIR